VKWLLGLVIILSADSGTPSAGKPTVVFVGDSITVLATSAIQSQLGPSYHVEFVDKDGIRINQSLPALVSALKRHPSAVVENLGTNDALQAGAGHDWGSSWHKLILMMRNTRCVVLTTINPVTDAYSHRSVATRINADIMALAARNPTKYKVADWSGFLKRHVTSQRIYLRPEPILIHPSPAGALKIAALDKDALAKCGRGTS
jgi:lysophospholipase L1-like esterase